MYIKRFLSVFILIMFVSILSVSPLIVEAASYTHNYYENVFTYKVNVPKKYSRNNAAKGWTGTTTTSTGSSYGYDVSYKEAEYREYKDVKGKYVQTFCSCKGDDEEIVKTDIRHEVATTAVKREHVTKIHRGSNSSSSVVEKITINVIKPS